MKKKDLDSFFIREYDWVTNKITTVAKKSPINIVRHNQDQALDIVSYIYEVLLKKKNLEYMQTDKHIKGKINNIVYIELTKTQSKFVKTLTYNNKVNKNDGLMENINSNYMDNEDLDNHIEYDNKVDGYKAKGELLGKFKSMLEIEDLDNIDRLYDAFICFRRDADKARQNLYDIIIIKKINTIEALGKHLDISPYSSYQIYKEFKQIIALMYSETLTYDEAIEKISIINMKTIMKKNKFGLFQIHTQIETDEINQSNVDEIDETIDKEDENIDEEE